MVIRPTSPFDPKNPKSDSGGFRKKRRPRRFSCTIGDPTGEERKKRKVKEFWEQARTGTERMLAEAQSTPLAAPGQSSDVMPYRPPRNSPGWSADPGRDSEPWVYPGLYTVVGEASGNTSGNTTEQTRPVTGHVVQVQEGMGGGGDTGQTAQEGNTQHAASEDFNLQD